MPAVLSYPGVYIEELPSGVRTITGVSTSITAFIGSAMRGPANDPVRVQSFAEFERTFGGLWMNSTLGYAVFQFFQNGGGDALIVRVASGGNKAACASSSPGLFYVKASTAGTGGNNVTIEIAPASRNTADLSLFKIIIYDPANTTAPTTTIDNVSWNSTSSKYVGTQLPTSVVVVSPPTQRPTKTTAPVTFTGGAAAITNPATPAKKATADANGLQLQASTAGIGGNSLTVEILDATLNTPDPSLFQVIVTNTSTGVVTKYDNLSITPTPTFGDVVVDGSQTALTVRPANTGGPIPLTGGVGSTSATAALGGLPLSAVSIGTWGNSLQATVALPSAGKVFNLTINDTVTGATETFLNLSLDLNNARFVTNVLDQGSNLVQVPTSAVFPNALPSAGTWTFAGGTDGSLVGDSNISDASTLQGAKSGIWALEKADLFNLLCIPPLIDTSGQIQDVNATTRSVAATYCEKRRALFLVDPLVAWKGPSNVSAASTGIDSTAFGLARNANAAVFFPMLRVPDPLREGQIGDFAPCGAVAGVMARTDATRGVWKAPAGIDATLNGVVDLSVKLTDGENGQLNPLGVNCLRSFPVIGRVVWGSRTMKGADQLADQWKYIPVRRLALFLEESLFRGTQWVVFEPNDEPLWAQIRLNIGAFMHNLFRQGAFQGMTPKDAYFVKCDKDTTTQNDIDLGIVNIVVGFAPLKPAEFVVIKIQQIAGQVES